MTQIHTKAKICERDAVSNMGLASPSALVEKEVKSKRKQ